MAPNVFEVGVAHVVDGEEEDVCVVCGGGADGGVEGGGFFFGGFLLDAGGVDYAGAFGARHCCVRFECFGQVSGFSESVTTLQIVVRS